MSVQHLMSVWVKQWPNYLTLWPAEPVLRITFVQYLILFCSRPEVTSDVISSANVGQVSLEVPVKFCDSSSNASRDIRLTHFVTNNDNERERERQLMFDGTSTAKVISAKIR